MLEIARSLHFPAPASSKQREKDSLLVLSAAVTAQHKSCCTCCDCELAVLLIRKESGPGPPLPVLANAESLLNFRVCWGWYIHRATWIRAPKSWAENYTWGREGCIARRGPAEPECRSHLHSVSASQCLQCRPSTSSGPEEDADAESKQVSCARHRELL